MLKSQATQQCRRIPAYPRTWPANPKSDIELLLNKSELICIFWRAGSNGDAREIFMKIFWKTKKLDLIELFGHWIFERKMRWIYVTIQCEEHLPLFTIGLYTANSKMWQKICQSCSIKSNFFVFQKKIIKISRASQLDPARHKTLSSHWVYSTPNSKVPAFYIALGG